MLTALTDLFSSLQRNPELAALREYHGPFDEIFQFTNVARPGCIRERFHSFFRNGFNPLLHLARQPRDEKVYEQWNVLTPVPKRRNLDGKNIQPVEQIFAKLIVLNHCCEVAVRSRDQTYINVNRSAVFPSRSNSCSCNARKSFGCNSRLMSPISSRNMVP